jgi:hypothetical protein
MSKPLLATFARLRDLHAFQRQHLQFLTTLDDFLLACEVGYGQANGAPLTMNDVLRLDIGSVATVQRQIRRLRKSGAVAMSRSDSDGRVVLVTLTPKALKALTAYGEMLGLPNPASI